MIKMHRKSLGVFQEVTMESDQKMSIPMSVPVVTKARFSEMSGLTEETLRGMIERGHLPTLKVGKHRMINVALLTKECLEQDFERF